MDKEELIFSYSKRMNDLIDYLRLNFDSNKILYIVQKLNKLFQNVPEFIRVFIDECEDTQLIIEWEINWNRILNSLKINDDVLAGLEF